MSKELTQLKEHIATRSEERIDEPRQYKVLLHNDDYTTMDFVVQVLESVFHKPPAEAAQSGDSDNLATGQPAGHYLRG